MVGTFGMYVREKGSGHMVSIFIYVSAEITMTDGSRDSG